MGRGLGVDEKFLWLHMERIERLLLLTFLLTKGSYEVKSRILLSWMNVNI